jgi:hypothetical protein
MAATSTNKQPLLVDRVLHYVVNLDTSTNDGMDITGTNTASLLVDATNTDGAILEDIYLIARSATQHTVNLYISSARDYLRPNEANFVGRLVTDGLAAGEAVHWSGMPLTLTPVPQVGDKPFNQAFYLPKGSSLWAARDGTGNLSNGPLIGCQGGWY